jgi:tetratricopeptide (TPR) repeat protein
MQKQKKKITQQPKAVAVPSPTPSLFGISFKVKCIILAVICFAFYINTVGNEFALDDGIVIIKNDYVQKGFGGIGKILSTDAYDSYYKQMNAAQMLAGGRYRPLSIVVFAIEHSLFGESWPIRHAISVLFYMGCILSIFFFLSKYLLKKISGGEDIAFVATLLFAIHPMHTEVVANVKSLDEILSLLCIMGTLIFALKYTETKKSTHLFLGLFSYLLALLAKEYAVMLALLLPLAFYLLANKKPIEAFLSSIPYYAVLAVYMLMRIGSVGIPKNVPGGEILNNPYLLATHGQKIATEWLVLGKYLAMLFIPYPLSSDYSYNTIPYHTFSNITVLLSILVYVGMVAWGVRLAMKRNILSFAIFFYLFNLAMVSNFLVDIGATMGERLAFHSSLGFTIVLAYGLFFLLKKVSLQNKKNIVIGSMSILLVLCGVECIPRNAEWKNDVTLFTTDVNTVPNSAMVLGNAGARYIDLAEKAKDKSQSDMYIRKSIQCLAKSLTLNKGYVNSYLNLGVAYYKLEEPDSAKMCWDVAKRLYPNHPNLKEYYPLLAESYLHKGLAIGKHGNLELGIQVMKEGIPYDPRDVNLWYNLGGAYFTMQKYDSAKAAWTRTLLLKPDYKFMDKNNQPASLADLVKTVFVQ